MNRTQAELLSAQALAFLSERPGDLQRFLTATGLDARELLRKHDDRAILGAALAHVANAESLAREFSEAMSLKAGALVSACALLDPHGSSAW